MGKLKASLSNLNVDADTPRLILSSEVQLLVDIWSMADVDDLLDVVADGGNARKSAAGGNGGEGGNGTKCTDLRRTGNTDKVAERACRAAAPSGRRGSITIR